MQNSVTVGLQPTGLQLRGACPDSRPKKEPGAVTETLVVYQWGSDMSEAKSWRIPHNVLQ